MALISDSSKIMPVEDKRRSASQNTDVGSGSRPTPSRIKIADSAPRDPHGLDGRMTPGALGSGKMAKPMGY